MHKIQELILDREEELMNNGYSLDFTKYCKKIWNQYLEYSIEHNDKYINYSIENSFLKEKYGLSLTEYTDRLQKHPLNVINILNNFEKFNNNNKLKSKMNIVTTETFKNEILKYLDYCEKVLNNSETTVREKNKGITIFVNFLSNNNIFSFKDITKDLTLKYIDSYKDELKSRRIFLNFSLRGILDYLYEEGILKKSYSYLIPVIKRHRERLPKPFNKEDAVKIINYLNEHKKDTTNGYRNYAMTLIAATTGLRKIDIINLKYSSIDWKNNEINLLQQKTKVSVKIPMTSDVGQAIIDYIKLERSFKLSSNDEYIFIRKTYPLEKLSDSYSFYPIIYEAMLNCQIDYKKYKKIGLHSFRFTLATEMLNNEIPLAIISSTLGHANIKSTYTYLKVNINNLKKCFVEVDYEL